MRTSLLGTTALVSVALLTEAAFAQTGAESTPAPASTEVAGIRLELRGYAQFGLAAIPQPPDDPVFLEGQDGELIPAEGSPVVFGSDSEVHFRGSTTLDNGLAISFRAELELEDDSEVDFDSDTIDEVYVQFDAFFGRVQFGMQDGAPDQMIISAPNIFAQLTISSIDMNPFEMYASPELRSDVREIMAVSSYLDTSPDFTEDFTKIIYFSPRIYGTQVGISYTPNPCRNDTGFDIASGTAEQTTPDPLLSCGNAEVFGSNYWEVAGNVSQNFTGFGMGVSGSYGSGDGNGLAVELTPGSSDEGDATAGPKEWHAGGELFVNMGGGKLTIGGAYKQTENFGADNVPIVTLLQFDPLLDDVSSRHWDLGATYDLGRWELGGSYGQAETSYFYIEGAGSQDAELSTFIGGVSYKMGPGIRLGVGVIHSDAQISPLVPPFDNGLLDPGETRATSVFSELDLRF